MQNVLALSKNRPDNSIANPSTELLLNLKQGQYEVRSADFEEIRDSSNQDTISKPILINKQIILSLNEQIHLIGKEKIAVLDDIRRFRHGLNLLE